MKYFLILPLLVLSYHTESSPKASIDLIVQQNVQELEGDSEDLKPNFTPLSLEGVYQNYEAKITNDVGARSYKYIWVKMFPLTSVPFRDPYPTAKNKDKIELHNEHGFQIIDFKTKNIIAPKSSAEVIKSISIDFKKKKLYYNGDFTKVRKLIIRPMVDREPLDISYPSDSATELVWDHVNKRGHRVKNNTSQVNIKLRGVFVVDKTRQNQGKILKKWKKRRWSVINVLLVDDYLKSVVPSEVPASWHEEALKAQSVAARTYAVREMLDARNLNRKWDVDPTTWFQSYRGISFKRQHYKDWLVIEQKTTTFAVEETADQIITYNDGSEDKIIKAYFSSNSGGITCSAKECFKTNVDVPYLISKQDVDGVQDQPAGRWGGKAEITSENILNILVERGYPDTLKILKLKELRRGSSQRVWQLKVILDAPLGQEVCSKDTSDFTNCKEIVLDESESRAMMSMFGPIRSRLYYLFDVGSDGKQKIKGFGYGHGVGLCQYGAKLLANRGEPWDEILKFYYTNVDITTVYQR